MCNDDHTPTLWPRACVVAVDSSTFVLFDPSGILCSPTRASRACRAFSPAPVTFPRQTENNRRRLVRDAWESLKEKKKNGAV